MVAIDFPVVAVRGRSGSGKTALIGRIIKKLATQGSQVIVIKHSTKAKPSIDPKGKDTAKHLEAGASLVVGSFDQSTFFFLGASMALDRVLRVSRNLGDWDLCLIEGHYLESFPNIVLKTKDVNELTIANSAEEPFELIIEKLQKLIPKTKP
ncbi:MAG: molybdopterin-guanine dinucleotide biosynthesis protein B [Candidatus Hodarchaeales archaeon]|jgi:molybdopterin-guanine dinucleotide biosynthesis protein B